LKLCGPRGFSLFTPETVNPRGAGISLSPLLFAIVKMTKFSFGGFCERHSSIRTMNSSKPDIPWRRVEPTFVGAAVSPPQGLPSFLGAPSSAQDTPMRAPARARPRLGILVSIGIVLGVASSEAYWAFDRMAAKPTAPVSAPKPAEVPQLVGPAPPEPVPPARLSSNLVEGGAPLLAPSPRSEQEMVITPPLPSREEMPEHTPTAVPPRKAQTPRTLPPSASTRAANQGSGIRF
jgi:hypothetical protein